MKVFLSWSGVLSHKVALAFKEWLPEVIQSIDAFVSSEDIDKGARWSAEMAEELEKSRFGIICVTKENVGKPWINFEAGALSRSIEKGTVLPFSSAVSPFLFDLKSSDLEGPLTQFQYVVNEQADVFKLIVSINSKVDTKPLPADKLEKAFDRCWPDLKRELEAIATNETPASLAAKTPTRKQEDILDELLELMRTQQRLMLSKEDIGPLLSSLVATIRSDIQTLGQQSILRFREAPSLQSLLDNTVGGTGIRGLRGNVGKRVEDVSVRSDQQNSTTESVNARTESENIKTEPVRSRTIPGKKKHDY